MKKIVLASAAMGGAALVAFGAAGTFAAYSDQTAVEGQAANADVLLLNANGTTSTPATAIDMAPGDTAFYPYYVQNSSKTVPGSLGGYLTDVTDKDNGCNDAEAAAGDNCTNDAGELSSQLQATYYEIQGVDDAATCLATTGPGTNQGVTLGVLANGPGSAATAGGARVLQPGTGACYMVGLLLPNSAGTVNNLVQSDSTTFSVNFQLVQATS